MFDLTSVITRILAAIGAITVVIGAIFALRNFYQWLLPIRITPAVKMVLDKSGPDQILATATNVSREDQYLVRCVARGAFSRAHIIRSHLRHPFMRPRFYKHIRYDPLVFPLMSASPIKLAPFQREELHYSMSNRPWSVFWSSLIQIEVELSTGRIIRSGRLKTP